MGRAWLWLLCLLGSGVTLPGTPEPVPGPGQRREGTEPGPGQRREGTELAEALQELLQNLGPREPQALEKRLSWVPWCRRGEPCAVRRGARFGKLCSCPRGSSCDLSGLKCS